MSENPLTPYDLDVEDEIKAFIDHEVKNRVILVTPEEYENSTSSCY